MFCNAAPYLSDVPHIFEFVVKMERGIFNVISKACPIKKSTAEPAQIKFVTVQS